VADNLDIGRPDQIKLVFARQIRTTTTKSEFATKVVTRGTEVTINAFDTHSRIKEYLKEGRALRIETVINAPNDLGCQRRVINLPELKAKAAAANRRLLEVQRAGQGCAIETALFERISQPSVEEGHRTGALRFGDPCVMALTGALCVALTATVGFTNKSLRALVSQLLDRPYAPAQMTTTCDDSASKASSCASPTPTPTSPPLTASEPPCSTRSSTTGSSRPTSHRPRPSSAKPSAPSTTP